MIFQKQSTFYQSLLSTNLLSTNLLSTLPAIYIHDPLVRTSPHFHINSDVSVTIQPPSSVNECNVHCVLLCSLLQAPPQFQSKEIVIECRICSRHYESVRLAVSHALHDDKHRKRYKVCKGCVVCGVCMCMCVWCVHACDAFSLCIQVVCLVHACGVCGVCMWCVWCVHVVCVVCMYVVCGVCACMWCV